MFDRKLAKKQAKAKLKKHYVIFVAACLFASFIGANFAKSTAIVKNEKTSINVIRNDNETNVLYDLLMGDVDKSQELVDNTELVDVHVGNLEIGHTKGVFATIASSISTGSFLIVIYRAISGFSHGGGVWAKIAVVFAALFLSTVLVFVRNAYQIIYRRIFLEGYKYDEVKAPRFLFIFRCRKVLNSIWCALKVEIFLYLWWFTIIGGIIKSCSYAMLPYIVAENPSIKSKDAIKLSRDMMNGHKWEYAKCQLTFAGWFLLDIVTLGLSGIFFSNPYIESFNVEYYAYVRTLAIDKKLEGYEYLNDKYLFEFASKDELLKVYGDLYKDKTIDVAYPEYGKVEGFFAKNFGVVLDYNEKSKQYNDALLEEAHYELYKDIFNNEDYPERLSPQDITEKSRKDTIVLANRQYSVSTLLVIFFALSFVGWLWEVSLHLLNDGTFVNRGVLHGPWLPVYGSGVVLILVILYRFRKNMVSEFCSAVVLCGFVKYYTSVFLELTHNGMRWWDYTGYFLNLNGRICAEGLLVFGLGGCAAVYFLAPMIDNLLKKAKPKLLKIICVILVLCFIGDNIYSHFVPNTGEGITSDVEVNRNEEIC